jgi:TIR domain-containing protein
LANIFVSYRNDDATDDIRKVFSDLENHYGKDSVFVAADNISPGTDFRQRINEAMGSCDLVIALVGPSWRGRWLRRRIFDADDWVRIEVEAALRKCVPVLPLIVDGARMPAPGQVPDSIEPFCFLHAAQLDATQNLAASTHSLIEHIDRILRGEWAPPSGRRAADEPQSLSAIGFGILGLLILGGGLWIAMQGSLSRDYPAGSLSGIDRLTTLFLLGLAVGFFHALLWNIAERYFRWRYSSRFKYSSGGYDKLPTGWEAIVLSLTMTGPLALVPLAYDFSYGDGSDRRLITDVPRHLVASLLVFVSAAIGHLVLYGTKVLAYGGLRNIVYSVGAPANLKRGLLMELIYGCVHFASIVLVYRFALQSTHWLPTLLTMTSALVGLAVFVSCGCIFISFWYPESLIEKSMIELRGAVLGGVLCVSLIGGMLM